MSLIFDRFPTIDAAEAFRDAVRTRYGLDGTVFTTDSDAYADDARPWDCEPPIVHIDRAPDRLGIDDAVALEERVEAAVEEYGGVYTGT